MNEAAITAAAAEIHEYRTGSMVFQDEWDMARYLAEQVIAKVQPLIRSAVLAEAREAVSGVQCRYSNPTAVDGWCSGRAAALAALDHLQ